MHRFPRKLWVCLGWALLSVLSGVLLLGAQRQGERDITRVFEDRTVVAAQLTETYTRDLLDQERRVAAREFAGARVSSRDLASVTNLFGYEAAVLLDARGRALRVAPAKASLIGKNLAQQYAHLAQATAGRTAVSKVVASAAEGIPVVAFATPFETPRGRRVFSGAFDVEKTPIGAYLRNATSLKGARVYLIDSAHVIVASNRADLVGLTTLAEADPDLARGLQRSAADDTGDGYRFASRPVGGTPWRLAISVPSAQLFQPVRGFRRYVPWMLWVAAVLAGLGCALLVGNLLTSRARLRRVNGELDRLVRLDPLTGLDNRRQAQASLDHEVGNADHDGRPLSVLMIDVDRFKAINDAHGHQVGDEALQFVAEVVRNALRGDDLIARWGGEELLAVLPSTDLDAAQRVAERVRRAVSSTPLVVGSQLMPISVSIGVAAHSGADGATLVAQADAAMYAAKAAGRDNVSVAG